VATVTAVEKGRGSTPSLVALDRGSASYAIPGRQPVSSERHGSRQARQPAPVLTHHLEFFRLTVSALISATVTSKINVHNRVAGDGEVGIC